MTRFLIAGLIALVVHGAAAAQPVLEHPDAFEHGFAVSFYRFDACGDRLAGRMFRRALAARFAQCPFSSEARSRYQERSRALQAKAQRMMADLIESRGGLPLRLDGMAMTCHEQQSSEDYRDARAKLQRYAQGELPADAVITAPCDAPDIVP